MNGRDLNCLRHVLDSIARIDEYTAGGRDAFDRSKMIQDAVLRNIEIIGEAVKALSAETRAAHPSIPWPQIARMRDRLIHHYFGVDLNLVWEVVARDLPPLRRETEAMLAEADGSARR